MTRAKSSSLKNTENGRHQGLSVDNQVSRGANPSFYSLHAKPWEIRLSPWLTFTSFNPIELNSTLEK